VTCRNIRFGAATLSNWWNATLAPDNTECYSIEAFNAVGDTIAVTAVPSPALEVLREDEILCARPMG
jgi:hypothetical protein